jgi:hypothetical protein
MKLNDIIFVPSVQHTGTWFVINFLRNFIPKNRELQFVLEKELGPGGADIRHGHVYDNPLVEPTIVHTHFPIVRNLNMDVNWPEGEFQRGWHAKLGTLRSLPLQTILLFCNFFKTVIPVRDPMAAILTREARHPQLRHFYIVDGFVAMATEFAKHPNVKFLPIDLATTIEQRAELLWNVLSHCDLDLEKHVDVIWELADAWEPENITPGNRFKPFYQDNNLFGLQHLLGEKWAEVEYLRNMSSVIMPFMSSLGYTREQLKY